MKLRVKDTLTEKEIEAGLRAVIWDGLTTQSMVTFTGGAFLVAFALQLGASNFIVGLLAAIPPLAHLVQIPAIFLVEKLKNRRAISVWASIFGRTAWLVIAFIPFLFSPARGITVLVVTMTFYGTCTAISICSWNSWMRDLVPQDRLGAFFSKRMSLSLGLGMVLSLAAGTYLDYWKTPYPQYEIYSYSLLFALGYLAGMMGVYTISRIPEPRIKPDGTKLSTIFVKPFRDTNFKNLLVFLGSWNFAVNLAAPFFTVYMLKRLELSMSLIIVLLVISQLANISFLRTWGRFSDRFSNKSVLRVSGPLFILCILAWTFTTLPEKHSLTLPLLVFIHVIMGISTAGVVLATGNIALKSAPKGSATPYLATTHLVNSLAAGIAPILGGKFADLFARYELSWTLKWTGPGQEIALRTLDLRHWDFFFFFAFLIGLYSIRQLAKVKETGEVKEKIVVQELISEIQREMRNFSTAGGLRQMVSFPFAVARRMNGRLAKNGSQREVGAPSI